VLFSKESREWTERMRKRHVQVTSSLRHEYRFVFDPSTTSLSVNNQPMTSGVCARLICAMIREYLNQGTREFPNAFFHADARIVKSKLDKSLNLHLKRAMQHVRTKAPLITLLRETGSGIVRFSTQCALSYEERESTHQSISA